MYCYIILIFLSHRLYNLRRHRLFIRQEKSRHLLNNKDIFIFDSQIQFLFGNLMCLKAMLSRKPERGTGREGEKEIEGEGEEEEGGIREGRWDRERGLT